MTAADGSPAVIRIAFDAWAAGCGRVLDLTADDVIWAIPGSTTDAGERCGRQAYVNPVFTPFVRSAFPEAPPTHGSLTTVSIGAAILNAASATLAKLKALASKDRTSPLHGAKPDQIEASMGRLHLTENPVVSEDYAAIVQRSGLSCIVGAADAKPGSERKRFVFYSFGALFAEVRVDPQTGVVRVARLCGVYDCGRLIKPRTARSQLMGGMIFGLGAALTEETVLDPVNGLPVIHNLADYHVPACAESPEITIEVLNIPDSHIGEFGEHGVDELGTNGVPAAIGNAIFSAFLRPAPLASLQTRQADRGTTSWMKRAHSPSRSTARSTNCAPTPAPPYSMRCASRSD